MENYTESMRNVWKCNYKYLVLPSNQNTSYMKLEDLIFEYVDWIEFVTEPRKRTWNY